MKNDANRLLVQYREKRDQINQHLSRIESLNAHINAAEDDMVSLKFRYEACVKDRNLIGIHVLDRNDEVCILYERLNIQKEIAGRGEAALVDREDEIRKLTLIGSELDRKIDLEKGKLPLSKFLAKIDALELTRTKLNATSVKLGKLMENPNDPKRTRNLPGKDPGPQELQHRIANLEELLATQEEKLLEKDLILEEVTTLVTRLEAQTTSGKDDTYNITTRINDLTKRLKKVTRKTMAKVSELAMHQALSMRLYQEKSEKTAILEDSKINLVQGIIPTQSLEKDFMRAERQRVMQERIVYEKQLRTEKQKLGRFVDLYIKTNLVTTNSTYMVS